MTQAFLVQGQFYIMQPDGSLRPAKGSTDFGRPSDMSDAALTAEAEADPDARPMTDEEWGQAVKLPHKRYIHLGVDDDVLEWFKALGRSYQTRINAVLRRYYEAHRKEG